MISGVTAFSIAAVSLVLTLSIASIALTTASNHQLSVIRTQAPYMKRVGGTVLVMVGTWFAYLALANPTYLLS